MTIFTSSDFTGYTPSQPTGAASLTDTGSITLIKSDATTETVFDSLTTALKCLNFMNSKNMYYLMAGDDITIVNCQTKLLILENTFTNQKMINSYVFSYHGKKIKGIHRNLSNMVNLTDALISVGFKTNNTIFQDNSDLTAIPDDQRPRIKIVDWYYFSGANGSLLEDTTQIVF